MGNLYGYIRVSTRDQNEDRQLIALRELKIPEKNIFMDKQSGKDFQRKGYLALKNQMLRPGDTLVIKEMDRLGRDYGAIKDEWLDIQRMGVDIVIIDTPILNTKEKSDLEKNLICSIVFELLAYTAEKERRKIRIRQSEGIRLALDKGVKFGRPETALPDNYAEVIDLWKSNQITAVEAMKRLDMKKTTFYKLARRLMNAFSSYFGA